MEKGIKRAELLAPAASFDSVKAAFCAGADAVYIGGEKFGARAYADNMSGDGLLEAIDYAHMYNKKLYLTVNTLLKEEEIENQLYEYILPYYEQGLDAVIVQDIGVLEFIRNNFPKLPIHASTQMAITGEYTPKYFEKMNIERIVTARELSLKEIKNIHEKAPDIEIESFVHGALCMGYSGMCFFSSSLGNRSGNRGRCAQCCRLNYNLLDENGKKNRALKDKNYCLSPKDLCTINLLPQIIEAGVYSLKIEGRMKRAEYTAGVTEIYRKYLDKYLNEGIKDYTVSDEDMEKLADLYNRGGFTDGYYKRRNGAAMMSSERPNHFGVFAGVAKKTKKGLSLCAKTQLNPDDVLEFRIDSTNAGNRSDKKSVEKISTNFYKNEIDNRTEVRYNEFTIKEKVDKGRTVILPFNGNKNVNYDNIPVYRMRNEALLSNLRKKYIDVEKKIKADCEFLVSCNEPALLNVRCGSSNICITGDVIEAAINQKTTKEQLIKSLNKTGQTLFEFENISVNIKGDCFVPVKLVNELRRRALDELKEDILKNYRRTTESGKDEFVKINLPEKNTVSETDICLPGITVSLSSKQQAYGVIGIKEVTECYLDLNGFSFRTGDFERERADFFDIVSKLKDSGKAVNISLPIILRMEDAEYFKNNSEWLLKDADGILVHNLEQLFFIKELTDNGVNNIDIIADYCLYQMNNYSIGFLKETGVKRGTFPVELTRREMIKLAKKSCMPMELICYGYMPMMFTAQCQKKNSGNCDACPSNVFLQDRLGRKMLVRTNCEYCYNTIYNSEVFSLAGLENEIKELSPGFIRLNFTKEDADTMKSIILGFVERLYYDKGIDGDNSSFTRGHFRKGVE